MRQQMRIRGGRLRLLGAFLSPVAIFILRRRCSNVQGEILNSTAVRQQDFSFQAAISQFSGNRNCLISLERPSHSKQQHDSRRRRIIPGLANAERLVDLAATAGPTPLSGKYARRARLVATVVRDGLQRCGFRSSHRGEPNP
jgi:hypothetical protein